MKRNVGHSFEESCDQACGTNMTCTRTHTQMTLKDHFRVTKPRLAVDGLVKRDAGDPGKLRSLSAGGEDASTASRGEQSRHAVLHHNHQKCAIPAVHHSRSPSDRYLNKLMCSRHEASGPASNRTWQSGQQTKAALSSVSSLSGLHYSQVFTLPLTDHCPLSTQGEKQLLHASSLELMPALQLLL